MAVTGFKIQGLRLRPRLVSMAIFMGLGLICGTTAHAQEPSEDAEATAEVEAEPQKKIRSLRDRCIPLRRVRDVEIIDSQTIIWEVFGSNISHYKMTLQGRCLGLMAREAFVHSSSNGQLCDIGEWIRVAGGSRAICAIDRIEPWTPPPEADTSPDTDTDTDTEQDD